MISITLLWQRTGGQLNNNLPALFLKPVKQSVIDTVTLPLIIKCRKISGYDKETSTEISNSFQDQITNFTLYFDKDTHYLENDYTGFVQT